MTSEAEPAWAVSFAGAMYCCTASPSPIFFCRANTIRPVAVIGLETDASAYMVWGVALRFRSLSAHPKASCQMIFPSFATATEAEGDRFRRILARDKARARRMGVVTLVAWGLFLACIGGMVLKEHLAPETGGRGLGDGYLAMRALYYIAIAFSISWFVRSRSVGRGELLARLAELEEELEALKQQMGRQKEDGIPSQKEELQR